MTGIRLDHTIVNVRDKLASARFMADILSLPTPPRLLGPFAVVKIGDTSLDYIDSSEKIEPQHYAFLVGEGEFDAIFGRIRERGLRWWADPARREEGQINRWDDGRGLYFLDPDGHLLEILTRPYGSAGSAAEHPNPLVARPLPPPPPASS